MKAQALSEQAGKIIVDQRTNDFNVKRLGSCLTLPTLRAFMMFWGHTS